MNQQLTCESEVFSVCCPESWSPGVVSASEAAVFYWLLCGLLLADDDVKATTRYTSVFSRQILLVSLRHHQSSID